MQDRVCVEMPLSEAKSLLRSGAGSSGQFHVLEHDLESDLQAIKDLADSLESFSPMVGIETIEPDQFKRGRRPESLLLDVTGLAHLFGDENRLAQQVLKHCDELGYLPRIAIGDTVGIAWAAARYLSGQHFAIYGHPLVLTDGDRETVKQVPVDGLRLETAIVDSLYQLGIETIGQLQRLPRNDLAMRFGNSIGRRLDQLSGKLEETFVARRKPIEFLAEQLLEYPTHHRETIGVVIARLVTQLCLQMRCRQRGALEWTIRLACQTGEAIEFRVNLFQPTATTAEVMPLVEMQLEQALSPHTRKFRKRRRKKRSATAPGLGLKAQQPASRLDDSPDSDAAKITEKIQRPEGSKRTESSGEGSQDGYPTSQFHRYTTIQVQEICVSVTSDVLLVQKQRQLFDENPRLDRQSLAHLINRLASRLGNPSVVYPVLQSGAQPEYAYRLRPLVDPSRKQRRRRTTSRKQSHVLGRPLRLFHPARPLKRCDRVETESEVSLGAGAVSLTPNSTPQPPLTPNPSKKQMCSIGSASENQIKAQGLAAPAKSKHQTGSPTLLALRSDSTKPERVIRSWGPERIETGWWRGLSVCRDYWRVETETSQHFWVYRDLRSGQWFLHGEF